MYPGSAESHAPHVQGGYTCAVLGPRSCLEVTPTGSAARSAFGHPVQAVWFAQPYGVILQCWRPRSIFCVHTLTLDAGSDAAASGSATVSNRWLAGIASHDILRGSRVVPQFVAF